MRLQGRCKDSKDRGDGSMGWNRLGNVKTARYLKQIIVLDKYIVYFVYYNTYYVHTLKQHQNVPIQLHLNR